MKKIILVAASTLFLMGAAPHVEVYCERTGRDHHKTEQEFIISGWTAALTYNAANGQREIVSGIDCAFPVNDDFSRRAVCMRVFDHGKGLTVEQYHLTGLKGIVELRHTRFTQNRGILDDKHSAGSEDILMRCVERSREAD